jgi:hypothetical protein
MAHDGRQLEGLVAFVERVLLPQGFDVRTNERIFDEDGIQVAEFDIDLLRGQGNLPAWGIAMVTDQPTRLPLPGLFVLGNQRHPSCQPLERVKHRSIPSFDVR